MSPVKKRKVLTAIVVDEFASMSTTRESEIEEHIERFSTFVGPLDVETPTMFYDDAIRPGTELVIFDYGGMGSIGNSLLQDNSRRLVRWAIDHPSALVVVVSRCSWEWAVRHEIMDAGFADPNGLAIVGKLVGGKDSAPLLPNVIHDDHKFDDVACKQIDPIPSWWKTGLVGKKTQTERPARRHARPRRRRRAR